MTSSYQNASNTTATMKPFRTAMNYGALRDPVFAANTEGNVYAPSMSMRMNGNHGDNDDDDDDDVIDHTNHGVTVVPTKQHSFSPYEMNGGTVAAVAGPNYCIIASDTRCSAGYEILSRNVSHIHTFSNQNMVLASSGCKTDIDQLRSVLDIRCKVRFCLCVCVEDNTCVVVYSYILSMLYDALF
jgi:Proteasome subunit